MRKPACLLFPARSTGASVTPGAVSVHFLRVHWIGWVRRAPAIPVVTRKS
jgi:hypothetical protein